MHPIRRWAVVAACVLGLAAPSTALGGSFRTVPVTLSTVDGIALDARVYTPSGPTPRRGWPAVVYLHGWGGSKDGADAVGWASYLAGRGYVVLAYSSRGWGASGGLVDLAGAASLADVGAAVSWLGHGTGLTAAPALRPPVDANAIGLMGTSYGGGQTLLAASQATPIGVRAIVPVIPWSDLGSALVPGGWFKSGFLFGLLSACSNRCIPDLTAAYVSLARHANLDVVDGLLRARSSLPNAGRIHVPTLLLQGESDFLFPVEQTLALFDSLPAGVPKHLYIGGLGHAVAPNPAAEIPYYEGLAGDWFDRYLRRVRNGVDIRPPLEIRPDAPYVGRSTFTRRFPFASRTPLVLAADHTLQPGGAGSSGSEVFAAGQAPIAFKGPPAATATVLRGAPSLTLTASSAAPFQHLDAALFVVGADGSRLLVGLGSRWLEGSVSGTPATVDIAMSTIVADVPAGSHLELEVVESSAAPDPATYWTGLEHNPAGTSLTLDEGPASASRLTLPTAQPPSAPRLGLRVLRAGRRVTVALAAKGSVDFGDGTSASGRSLLHRYARAGTYLVSATRYDRYGFGATGSQTVRVR